MQTKKLTKAKIESLNAEGLKVMDSDCPGLELWIGKKAKTWYFRKKYKQKRFHEALGRYPDFSREMAVRKAMLYTSNLIQYGVLDPANSPVKGYPLTLSQAWEKYNAIPRSIPTFNLYKEMSCFHERPIEKIEKSEVKELHRKISQRGQVYANRVISLMRAIINHAIKEEIYTGQNPASGIRRNPETSRERYLDQEEVSRVMKAIREKQKNAKTRDGADALLLMLLTGQRKSNVLAMEWDEIDAESVWTIPLEKSKSGRRIVHPLCDEAIRIIEARRGNKSKYVFPAKGKKNVPTGDCKKLWAGILKEAGVKDCHIHDLRHTNATYQLRAGVDIATVSEMLGHRDISITKRVYAHVMNDSKRKAANAAAAAMLHPEG